MLGSNLISVRKINFPRQLLPDTLEDVSHDFPSLETGGKRVLNEVLNTPQLPLSNKNFHSSVNISKVDIISKEKLIEKLQSMLTDNPCRGLKQWSEKQRNSFEILADAIINHAKNTHIFVPVFSCQDVANSDIFSSAVDREYTKKHFTHEAWVKSLNKSLLDHAARDDTKILNYNVLRVFVAKDPLSRISFASESPRFIEEVLNQVIDASHSLIPLSLSPYYQISKPLNSVIINNSWQDLELTARSKRRIVLNTIISDAKARLLEEISFNYKPNKYYVRRCLKKIKNLNEREKNFLERELTVIIMTEKAFNDEITRQIKENKDPLYDEALIASNIDVNSVLSCEKVKKLQLTILEHTRQFSRLENRKKQIYIEDHGNSVFNLE
ncbi:hypothetical protein ASE93_04210 [Serratia sp. Leaf50]|nr:hypothetical protein ASE93_04210 [Serratia sp. Leaf50]